MPGQVTTATLYVGSKGACCVGERMTPPIRHHRAIGVRVAGSDNWCDALYFPFGRHKFGGVRCRLEPGHPGDHWCEAEDEKSAQEKSVDLQDVPHGKCVDCGDTTWLWCQEVNNWHCTSCDAGCP